MTTAVPSPRRPKPWPIAVLTAVLIAAVAGGTWFALHHGHDAPALAPEAAPPTAVRAGSVRYAENAPQLSMLKLLSVQAGALPLAEPLAARLVYDEDVTARIATSFAGRIVGLKAAPGDRVRAGQTLAEIDSPDFGSASADLHKAEADLAQKRHALDRASELLQAEVIARKDYEQASADAAQSQAEADRASLRLKNLMPHGGTVNGERLPLASPLNGVVTERNANPAMEVNPGLPAPLFVITDPRRLWLLIDLPEHLLSKVQVGAAVDVQVEAWPGEHFAARILQIGQVVDPNTRRIPVRAAVDNAALKLRPEMYARAVLPHPGTARAVEVPNTALVNDGLYTRVFVETAPREFSQRAVEVALHGTDTSFVSAGLKDGERIVSQGALLLAAELHSDDNAAASAVGTSAAAPAAPAPAGSR
jgi:cobalt-zinc-cadmium efflux system membrane fusion protein